MLLPACSLLIGIDGLTTERNHAIDNPGCVFFLFAGTCACWAGNAQCHARFARQKRICQSFLFNSSSEVSVCAGRDDYFR